MSKVTGKIFEEDSREPATGATVRVHPHGRPLEFSNAQPADVNGNFSIDVPPGMSITISSVGFHQITDPVPASGKVYNLKRAANELSEVTIIGTRPRTRTASTSGVYKGKTSAGIPTVPYKALTFGAAAVLLAVVVISVSRS